MAGPTYTYTPNVPQAATPFNQTQAPILNNFRAINEIVSVNHGSFNTNNYGKHNSVTMQFQTDQPTTQTNQITMFTQATPDGPNDAEIFITYPNNSTPVQISIPSTTNTPTGTSFGTATEGYVTFPSGIKIRWGVANMKANSSNTTINFTIGTPAFQKYMQCSDFTPVGTGSGSYNTMSVQANGYISQSSMNPAYSGAITTGTQNFNYLLMGY
jgi:hypothetical protein